MSRTFRSIHELCQHLYVNGGARSPYANSTLYYARHIFDQAEISKHIERARVLRKHVTTVFNADPTSKDALQLFKILTGFFRPMVDDVLLCSAFEMWAKATLLKRGYLIHDLRGPNDLRRQQQKQPIHVNTVRRNVRAGTAVAFADRTIAAAVLTAPEYARVLRLPAQIVAGMQKIISRRNMLHFMGPYGWDVDEGLIESASFLNEHLPGKKKSA